MQEPPQRALPQRHVRPFPQLRQPRRVDRRRRRTGRGPPVEPGGQLRPAGPGAERVDRGQAVTGVAAGTALLAGDGWAMSGGAAGSLTLAAGAIAAMLYVSAAAAVYARGR